MTHDFAEAQQVSKHFEVRVLDLNPDNIGQNKFGLVVEDGQSVYEKIELKPEFVLNANLA